MAAEGLAILQPPTAQPLGVTTSAAPAPAAGATQLMEATRRAWGQLLAAELAQKEREAGAHAAAERRARGPPEAPRCGSKFLLGLARQEPKRAKLH